MKDIKALKERGTYDIDILDEGKELIGLTVDTKRKQFYVIVPQDENNESVIEAYNHLKDDIIDKIAEDKYKNKLTGETKSNAEEVLVKALITMGVTPKIQSYNFR